MQKYGQIFKGNKAGFPVTCNKRVKIYTKNAKLLGYIQNNFMQCV